MPECPTLSSKAGTLPDCPPDPPVSSTVLATQRALNYSQAGDGWTDRVVLYERNVGPDPTEVLDTLAWFLCRDAFNLGPVAES